jgi:hypothetical protein
LLLSGPGTIACTALSRPVGLGLFLRGWTWRPRTASAAPERSTFNFGMFVYNSQNACRFPYSQR